LLVFDGTPQGYASIGYARGLWPWPAGEIFELYVAPPFQGVGLGKQLFRHARRTLKSSGFDRVIVWALEDNAMACGFYRALGGEVAASAPERYGKSTLTRVAFVFRDADMSRRA
jgi:ribosomal protein S18 acetylase RimI-like enzyme